MTLREAIAERQARKPSRERVERRADEIAAVHEIGTDYTKVDRAGDLEIEGRFQALYQLVDSPAEKQAVADAFRVWQRSEQREDMAVGRGVDTAAGVLKANNPFWLDA
jgi:hypothetical protein